MGTLSIDFSHQQRRLGARRQLLGWALLFMSLCAAGFAAWDFLQLSTIRNSLEDRRHTLIERTRRIQSNTPATPALTSQIQQANLAFGLIKAPWNQIFSDLEAGRGKLPAEIALLSIKGDAAKGEIALTGEAKTFAALTEFVSALAASSSFKQVTILNDKLSDGPPPVVVAFELRLVWQPLNAGLKHE